MVCANGSLSSIGIWEGKKGRERKEKEREGREIEGKGNEREGKGNGRVLVLEFCVIW